MTSSNKTKIFIDGQHGTTGLQILDRLKDRPDIELLELPMADRKDLGKRAEIAKCSRHRRALPARCRGQGTGGGAGRCRHRRDRRQHGPSRGRRLDLRLPRDGQGPSPEASGLQPHLQPGLLSDGRHRHPAAAGRCRHRARQFRARGVRRLGLHRRRQGADRRPRAARRRAVRPLRHGAHAQARAGDEEVLAPQARAAVRAVGRPLRPGHAGAWCRSRATSWPGR